MMGQIDPQLRLVGASLELNWLENPGSIQKERKRILSRMLKADKG
jgi:hypothetical protein